MNAPRSKIELPGTSGRMEQLEYVTLDDGPTGSSFVGTDSGGAITSRGENNTFFGVSTGSKLSQGTNNVLVGTDAGGRAQDISDVVAIGSTAVQDALSCSRIVSAGTGAGKNLRNATEVVTIGYSSGTGKDASQSVSVGSFAAHNADGMHAGCFIGHRAGMDLQSTTRCVGIGAGSLELSGNVVDSVMVGAQSGKTITSISNVVAIGAGAMNDVGCADTRFNTVVGAQAAQRMCGDENTVMGYSAASNVRGDEMTIMGSRAAQSLTGTASVIIGANLCNDVSVVDTSTVIGHDIQPINPGQDPVTYRNSVFIGNGLRIAEDEYEGSLVIGVGNNRFIQASQSGDMSLLSNSVFVGGQDLASFLVGSQSSQQLFVRTNGADIDSNGKSFNTAFRSIKYACSKAEAGQTIVVEGGEYYEDNPVYVPEDVSIVGQDLRSTYVYPLNRRKHMFFVNNGVYISNIRILNLRRPAYGMSFPCSQVDCTIQNGGISEIISIYSEKYLDPPSILVEPPPDGTTAVVTCTLDAVTGEINGYQIIDPGSGYTRRPHISIPAQKKVFIFRSPYINNCTIISQGVFDTNGNLFRNGQTAYPLDLEANDIDEQGGGGALLVDGNLVDSTSPLKSMLGGVYTAISHGAIAHWCINQGFSQLVSCYTHFPYIGFLCSAGGQMSISNSVCDFGVYGLRSEGYWPNPIATISVTNVTGSSVTGTLQNVDDRKPDIGSSVLVGTSWYRVSGAIRTGNAVELAFSPGVPTVSPGYIMEVYTSSRMYTGSFLFEFCGSGMSYNALPEYGGVPDPGKQVNFVPPGVVYHTSSDERGNMKVGDSFYVDQLTGSVQVSGNVDITGIERLGPFFRGGTPQGEAIEEITNRTDLKDSTGIVSDVAVSTSAAVQFYVDQRAVPAAGNFRQVLAKTSNNDYQYDWTSLQKSDVGLDNVLNVAQIPVSAYNQPQGVPRLDATAKLSKTLVGLDNVLNVAQIPVSAYNQPQGVPRLDATGKLSKTLVGLDNVLNVEQIPVSAYDQAGGVAQLSATGGLTANVELVSPSGNTFILTVDDDGTLGTIQLS
jgi:hypothetical protein